MYRTSSPSANASHNSPSYGSSPLSASGHRFSGAPTSSPNISQRKLPAEHRSSSSWSEGQTVITKASWTEAARESTSNFKMHGSPVPLVWVLVEDNVIPPNAVPFGEDKNGQLYIARALLEGGLYLGKIGAHLPHALIAYGGREHQIKTYEVLVCASQLRWGLPSFESVGSLTQGTVILAQQNQQQLQSQHGSAAWNAQAGGFVPQGMPGHLSHTQIGYSNVRETTTSTRETRSTYSSRESFVETTLSVNDIPRFIPDLVTAPPVDNGLKKLAGYKTVILIDDSISMDQEQSWTLVREALAGIADLANQYGSHGIDLHFLHHGDYHANIKTSHKVQQIFDQMRPSGQDTPTAAKLEGLINHYLPFVERKHPRHEPIDIIVITDGVATDNDALPSVIVNAAQRLERGQVPDRMFGIQFVQIGTDEDAAAALRALDDHLEKEYRIRDIVDFTPYDHEKGAFNTQYMLKILLGGIDKVLDNGGPASSQLLSPLRHTSTLAPSTR
ncbi:hypothetical protein M405DRAFT_878461 [Rhizopogon salebrosus TDB-379]|nr:hypothetical protein M405DRAFT_878461 [Rhizopogon salebrosus TDB-379]